MNRKAVWFGFVFVFAMLLGAIAQAVEPVKIGAVFSVTGPASFLGEPKRNTVKMLEADINRSGGILGRPVEFIVYDDESDATKTVTAVDRLIKKDRVAAIIGPSISGNTLAVIPKAGAEKIPLISCAAAKKITSPVHPYIFKVAPSDLLAAKRIFQDMKNRKLAKVAIITASDGYGAGGREDMKELAPQMGISIVADEVYGPKDTDMTAQLTKIKGTDAQAIVCWGTNPGPAVIARNRVQLGIKTPLYMSSGVASKKFIELAGAENAEGILLPAARLIVEPQIPADHPQKKVIVNYIKDYEGKYKQPVSTFGGHAHDAVGILVQAIKDANSTDPKAIRDALEKVKGFQGTWGEFNFTPEEHTGLTEEAFVMVKIVNGDWQMLK
ncbi:MAG: ABC transporter substrate-binding protein [Syntrophorhabdaceae bacterium]|nr:ABC transporter substrate-binding protein [Syntrophorhabdaceae bacterium]